MTTVAWISDFPIEWLPEVPESLRDSPRSHPTTWMSVLAGEFERRPECRLHVVAFRKRLVSDVQFERKGVQFHVLKIPSGTRAPSLFWMDTWRLRRHLRAISPDLVHAWGSERGASWVASRLPYPWLMTIQGLFTWYGEVVPLNIHERLARWGEQASLRRARVVTTESTFAVDFLRRRHPNLTVRQVEHAPNWVFHHVRRHPQLQPVRFLTVGTPGFRKGTDLLLRALGQVVNEFSFELISVGVPSDDFLAPLRRELPGDLWKFVQFRPAVTPAAIAEEMALATIFVLPTRADTSPNAVKEAAVAGVPVVASDVGGVPDYIASGRNGLLFRSGDLAGLVGVLREAVRHPLFGAGDVEPAILSGVRDYLSPATMARKFLAVYDEVLAARAPADG